MIKLISLSMLMISCGSQLPYNYDVINFPKTIYDHSNKVEDTFIDTEIAYFYNTFENVCDKQVNIPVRIESLEDYNTEETNIVGLCIVYPNGYKQIKIDNNFWDNATYNAKESLIYHEIGHCLLDREHNNNQILHDGYVINESIMNSFNIGNFWFYEKYKDYYYQELCK
jgi:hypothetical protein